MAIFPSESVFVLWHSILFISRPFRFKPYGDLAEPLCRVAIVALLVSLLETFKHIGALVECEDCLGHILGGDEKRSLHTFFEMRRIRVALWICGKRLGVSCRKGESGRCDLGIVVEERGEDENASVFFLAVVGLVRVGKERLDEQGFFGL